MEVLIGSQDRIDRAGISALFDELGHQVIGSSSRGDEVLRRTHALKPDVVAICDGVALSLTGSSLPLMSKLGEVESPPVVVVFAREGLVTEKLGRVEGMDRIAIVRRDRLDDPTLVRRVLDTVVDGGTYFDHGPPSETRGEFRVATDLLSPREREVLGLVAEGLSNNGIAERLFISPRSAEKHVGSIFQKLGMERDDLVHRRVRAALEFSRFRVSFDPVLAVAIGQGVGFA